MTEEQFQKTFIKLRQLGLIRRVNNGTGQPLTKNGELCWVLSSDLRALEPEKAWEILSNPYGKAEIAQ